jgi:hypothetical protein
MSMLLQLFHKLRHNPFLTFVLLSPGNRMSCVDSDYKFLEGCFFVFVEEAVPHFSNGRINGKVFNSLFGVVPWKNTKYIDWILVGTLSPFTLSEKNTGQGVVTGLEFLRQVTPDLASLTWAQRQEGLCS